MRSDDAADITTMAVPDDALTDHLDADDSLVRDDLLLRSVPEVDDSDEAWSTHMDWITSSEYLDEIADHTRRRSVADSVGYSDRVRTASHLAWLERRQHSNPPARDVYERPWRRRRVYGTPPDGKRADAQHVVATIAAQVGSLRRVAAESPGRVLSELADRADVALSQVKCSTFGLILARQRLGRCLSLGWPRERTRGAISMLEQEAARSRRFVKAEPS